VAEEVARIAGYETIAPTLPDTPMPAYRPDPLAARDTMRRLLAGTGLREVVTYALIAPTRAAALRWPGDAGRAPNGEAAPAGEPIVVTNPLSVNRSVLRQQLVLSLLDVVDLNIRQGRPDVAVFEIGKGYGRRADGPHEWWRLGLALTGAAEPAHWDRHARSYDLDDAKGIVEALAAGLGLPRVSFRPVSDGFPFHPGRTAIAEAGEPGGPGLVGWVGECHPALLAEWDIRARHVVIAELAVSGLTAGAVPTVRARPIPRHPAVERDLAVIVPDDRLIGEVAEIIRTAAGPELTGLRLFDVYRGTPLETGEKSLAFRLTVEAENADPEPVAEAVVQRVVAALTAAGARLRS